MDSKLRISRTQCRQRHVLKISSLWPLVILLVLLFGVKAEAISKAAVVAKAPVAAAPVAIAPAVVPPKAAPAPVVTAVPPKTAPTPVIAAKPPTVVAKAPVVAPVIAPIVAPVKAPVVAPVEAPVVAPVKAPVKAPVVAPVKAPVKAPVAAPSKAPTTAPVAPTTTPVAAPVASAPGPATALGPSTSGTGAALDASQVKALNALGITATADACASIPTTVLSCDTNITTRHLVKLSAQECPITATLTEANLLALSMYMKDLSFVNCHLVDPLPEPTPKMVSNLASLTVTTAPDLYGWWIGRLTSLTSLQVMDTNINASSLSVITDNLVDLEELIIINSTLNGPLPSTYPFKKLTTLDLSGNSLSGSFPVAISKLPVLKTLDLSRNQFTDHVISAIGDLSSLTSLSMSNNQLRQGIPKTLGNLHFLTKLDLSFNKLNGSIPDEIGNLPLTYLDLRNNSLSGAVPFTDLFISKLKTYQLAGNPDLCYNSTITSSKSAMGLPLCGGALAPAPGPDSFGPAPAPDGAASPLSGESPSTKKKPKIVVIVFATLGALVGLAAIVYLCCRYWGAKAGYE